MRYQLDLANKDVLAKDAHIIKVESELQIRNQMLERMEKYFERMQVSMLDIAYEKPSLLEEFEVAKDDVMNHSTLLETSSIDPLRRMIQALEQIEPTNEKEIARFVLYLKLIT